MQRADVENAVKDALRKIGMDEQQAAEIRLSDDLDRDLDIDSIEQVELAVLVWKGCGLPADRVQMDGVRTVEHLVDRVYRDVQGQSVGAA